jgi:hypothetical protein
LFLLNDCVRRSYLEGLEKHHVDETVEALIGLLHHERERGLQQRLADALAVLGERHEREQQVQVDHFLVFVVVHEDLEQRVVVAVPLEEPCPGAVARRPELVEAPLHAVRGQVRVVRLQVLEEGVQRLVLLAGGERGGESVRRLDDGFLEGLRERDVPLGLLPAGLLEHDAPHHLGLVVAGDLVVEDQEVLVEDVVGFGLGGGAVAAVLRGLFLEDGPALEGMPDCGGAADREAGVDGLELVHLGVEAVARRAQRRLGVREGVRLPHARRRGLPEQLPVLSVDRLRAQVVLEQRLLDVLEGVAQAVGWRGLRGERLRGLENPGRVDFAGLQRHQQFFDVGRVLVEEVLAGGLPVAQVELLRLDDLRAEGLQVSVDQGPQQQRLHVLDDPADPFELVQDQVQHQHDDARPRGLPEARLPRSPSLPRSARCRSAR